MIRRALLAWLLLAIAGCAHTHHFQRGDLGFISLRPLSAPVTVVDQNVAVRVCPPGGEYLPELLEKALAAAPGSNALVNAEYSTDGFCGYLKAIAVHVP